MSWLLLKNSLLVGSVASLLAAGFGVMAALCGCGLERRWRQVLLGAGVAAFALPPFLVTNCWLHYLGHTGVWRPWVPLDIFSLGGTVWILALLLWPITLFAAWSAWQRLEPSQLESDPAVTGWSLLRALLFPLARTALGLAVVLSFVLALNNFAVPAILQVKVSPAETWVLFNTTFDSVGALRLSWPLIVLPLLLLMLFAGRGIEWPRLEGPVSAKIFRRQLGPGFFYFCGAGTLLLCSLSVVVPLFQLISVKRTWTELPGALAAGQLAIGNSFFLAASSATIILAVGFAGARLTTNRPRFFSYSARLAGLLLWLPFLVPGVLLGIALVTVFNHAWASLFYQSAGIVILAFVFRYLAPGWTAASHALRSVDSDLTDAARLEGASRWQMLRHVHWPQVASPLATVWYIIFVLCLWDVESMILIVPPSISETLASRIFNLLHYGHNAQVNALCLTLLALALAPLVIWQVWSALGSRITRQASWFPSFSILLLIPLLLAGCGPKLPTNETPLQSQLFGRVQIIGSRGVGVGQLNKPRSVAVDSHDNLFVVDMTGRVQKFSSNGVFLLSWQMPQTDLGRPKGMCRDRDGNIVVVEPHYQRVNYFSPAGQLVAQWGARGTNTGQFTLPRAAAVTSLNEIFVSEYGTMERVQKFKWSENSLVQGKGAGVICTATFGKVGSGPGDFNRPEGLCVDAQDRLYVADSCNHRIQIFSSDGKFIRAYGRAGSGKGQLSYPYDICVDKAGRQYVCEFGNSRIQIFDAQDQPLEIIGGPGAEPGQFSNPWGVALDSAGNLYVADSQNHRVQKLLRKSSAPGMLAAGQR
jgi:ABC-type Fe3+ transport system permease subunit/DNA-binding beta-propeller fold protein YncE